MCTAPSVALEAIGGSSHEVLIALAQPMPPPALPRYKQVAVEVLHVNREQSATPTVYLLQNGAWSIERIAIEDTLIRSLLEPFDERQGFYTVHQLLLSVPANEPAVLLHCSGCMGVAIRYLGQGLKPMPRDEFVQLTGHLGHEP